MSNKLEENEIIISIFKFIGFILLSIYSVYMRGWVILDYWNWFLLPVFPDMKIITFIEAIWLSSFVILFHGFKLDHYNKTFEKKYIDDNSKWIYMFITPLVLIGIGWLIHVFVK